MVRFNWQAVAFEWALGAGLVMVVHPVMVKTDILESRDAVSAGVVYVSTLVVVLLLREWLKARTDRDGRD